MSGKGGAKVGMDDYFAAGGTVDGLIARAQKELKLPPHQERQTEHERVGDVLPDAPVDPELRIPLGYEVGLGGVTRIKTDMRDLHETRMPVAGGPVLIGGRLEDLGDGRESVVLFYHRAGRWRRVTTDRATIANARALVELSAVGVPVTSGSAAALVEYLSAFENTNIERLPHAYTATQMGWQGDGGKMGFLWGRRLLRPGDDAQEVDVEQVDPREWSKGSVSFKGSDAGDEQIAAGFTAQGTYGGWREAVAPLKDYPRLKLNLYASLTPPILPIIGAPNFVVDTSNPTSTGKTVALRVGASAWGNPDERTPESVLHTWDATRVWIERASAVLNSLPLMLDDTKRAKHPRIVGQTLYDSTSGTGRGRGSPRGMARAGSWTTVLLSTG